MVVITITIGAVKCANQYFRINAPELETMTSFKELRDTNAGQSFRAVVFEIRLHPSTKCDARIGWRGWWGETSSCMLES